MDVYRKSERLWETMSIAQCFPRTVNPFLTSVESFIFVFVTAVSDMNHVENRDQPFPLPREPLSLLETNLILHMTPT